MGSYLSTLITAGTIAAQPSALSSDIKGWIESVLNHRNDYCADATRTKYIYVSDSEGSDSNDGLTEETPVKTLSKAQTLLSSRGSGTNILLKRGDIWQRQSITIGTSNTKLGAYGLGEKPVLIGCEKIAAGSGSWTHESSNAYSASVDPLTGVNLVFAGDPSTSTGYAYLRECAMGLQPDQSGVISNPGSYARSSTDLLIQLPDGADPDTVDVWYRESDTTAPTSADGVLVTADQCIVTGLRVLGYGNLPAGQHYNISVETSGTDHVVVDDCDILFNASHHVYGHYTNTNGGITLWKDCEVGYCNTDNTDASTLGIDYAANGGQESYRWNITTIGGPLDGDYGTGQDVTDGCQEFKSHAGGSPTYSFRFGIDYKVTTDIVAGNLPGLPCMINNQSSGPSNRDDFDDYGVLIVDEVFKGDGETGQLGGWLQSYDTARINPKYTNCRIIRNSPTNNGATLGPMHGTLINWTLHLHIGDEEESKMMGFMYAPSADYTALVINGRLHITWDGDSTVGDANDSATAAASKGFVGRTYQQPHNHFYNCVFSIVATEADLDTWTEYGNNIPHWAYDGTPDLTAGTGVGTGGYADCAFYYCNPTVQGAWNRYGWSNSHSPYDATNSLYSGTPANALPSLTENPDKAHYLVDKAQWDILGEELEYDQDWRARSNDVLGPLEIQAPTSTGNAAWWAMYRRRKQKEQGDE